MDKYSICLNTLDKVKKFVNITNKYDIEALLCCGRYAIDCQSIIGIFSMDLRRNLELKINFINPPTDLDRFVDEIKEFIV